MSNQHENETEWNSQPFTAGEFVTIVVIPIGFVILASAILFIMVIRAGG